MQSSLKECRDDVLAARGAHAARSAMDSHGAYHVSKQLLFCRIMHFRCPLCNSLCLESVLGYY